MFDSSIHAAAEHQPNQQRQRIAPVSNPPAASVADQIAAVHRPSSESDDGVASTPLGSSFTARKNREHDQLQNLIKKAHGSFLEANRSNTVVIDAAISNDRRQRFQLGTADSDLQSSFGQLRQQGEMPKTVLSSQDQSAESILAVLMNSMDDDLVVSPSSAAATSVSQQITLMMKQLSTTPSSFYESKLDGTTPQRLISQSTALSRQTTSQTSLGRPLVIKFSSE